MKENKSAKKIKQFAKRKWDNFVYWFTEKEHPRSKLNKNVFFYDSLKFIGLILVFLIIYSNIDKLNQLVLIFIKLGSLLELVLIFFILKKAWYLIANLKYSYRGLNNGTKAIIGIAIVLLLLFAFVNQEKVVNSITQTYGETNFSKFNPVQIPGNFSFGNFSFSSSFSRPTYYCSNESEKCESAIKTCEASVLFEESSPIDMWITISKKSSVCSYRYKVENSIIGQLEGKTMTCEVPLSKLGGRPDETDNWKYCKGSLKDTTTEMLSSFVGLR